MNCRKVLIDSGRLRRTGNFEAENTSSKGIFSTLRKLNKKSNDTYSSLPVTQKSGKKLDAEAFKHFPQSYWSYTTSCIQNSLMVITDPEQESDSVNNFNRILSYSGLTAMSEEDNSAQESIYDNNKWSGMGMNQNRDPVILAQRIIERVVQKESSDIFKNEFFLQLIKQTTDHPDPNSKVNVKHWQLLALASSITFPTDRRILSYLYAHLRKCSIDSAGEEKLFASFCLKNLQGTLETRGRKYPPSKTEVISTINRRRIYARIHFLDGKFQAVEFDACATIFEVMEQIQLKIGLRRNAPGYALFQVLGDVTEQSIQAEEKVGDALSVWEKWHEDSNRLQGRPVQQHLPQHYFIFKKHLFLDSFVDFSDRVERELIYHQFIYQIKTDKFPLSSELEAVMLCALKAQIDFGDFQETFDQNVNHYTVEGVMMPNISKPLFDYRTHMSSLLPPRLLQIISPEEVITQHQSMKGMDRESAKNSFFNLIKSWPLYRSTVFDVQQTYTSVWPKNLWLAVDSSGIHLLEYRTRNLLASCDYRSMINYSRTQTALLIVTLGQSQSNQSDGHHQSSTAFNNKTSKFLFLTHHAMQIASLIRDYTTVIAKERGVGRRNSVEFDLATKTHPFPPPPASVKGTPPLPPPRPSLSSRQQHQQIMMQQQQQGMRAGDVYGNIYGTRVGHPPQVLYGQTQQPQAQQKQFLSPAQQVNLQHGFQPTHRRQKPVCIPYKPPLLPS